MENKDVEQVSQNSVSAAVAGATGTVPKLRKYTDYQKREREKVKSPFREMKVNRAKSERICSVGGCKNKVAPGLRFLCLAHYTRGGENFF